MLNKSVESALAAMTQLAAAHAAGRVLTADQIAAAGRLARPFVAKLLTQLSRANLVASKPGPNGGFSLARDPAQITLHEVASCVGYRATLECCPFGKHYGPETEHCPLHHQVEALAARMEGFLRGNTLAAFATDAAPAAAI